MTRSMTGFGRACFEVEGQTFAVEIRALNHRYLDVQLRLPRLLGAFDPEVRSRLKERFGRGRLEVTVAAQSAESSSARLRIDADVVSQYLSAAEALRRSHPEIGSLDLATLFGLPGVAGFVEAEPGESRLGDGLLAALDEAAGALDTMRCREGAALERDLRSRLDRVTDLTRDLEARSGEVRVAVRERLGKRVEELSRETGVLDEARLSQEVALAAERMDITEELVRLRSHVGQFGELLSSSEPVGRRLDFLLQEMGREVNTVGSKGADAPLSQAVVELKAELERIREQVQNVE